MSQPLSGAVALVTGAARYRGIGRATALRLAELGARIAVAGRVDTVPHEREQAMQWSGLDSLVVELQELGVEAIAVTGDVARSGDVEHIVAATVERFGRLDVVVNNAGTGRFGPTLVELPVEEWEHVVAVNLTGTFLVSREAAKVMIAGGAGGSIVNVASVAGRIGAAHMGGYSPAKFGVIGLTQVLATELAEHGIRVNAVAPGGIATDLEDATFAGIARELDVDLERAHRARVRRIPLGRLGSSDEAARAIAYLASPSASFITGQTLNVSGGAPYS